MNINRNNYEEFLLLYIDGELSSAQQKEVDFFLEQYLDIQQEFDLLLDTKLQVEAASFGDVSSLLKTENNEVSIDNYEEKFLLYVDSELSNNEKKQVELFVLQHPTLQTAFISINKTKLPIEIIAHPNKESLFKIERKPIILFLQRMAVAAVFTGLAASIWSLVGSNNNQVETLVNATPFTKNNVILPSNNNVKQVEDLTILNSTTTTKKEEKQKAVIVNLTSINNSKLNKQISNEIIKNIATPTPQPVPKEEQNTLQQINATNIAIAQTIQPQTSIPEAQTIGNVASIQPVISKQQTVAIAYKTLETENDSEKQETQQSKVKKLFKKVAKIFTPKDVTNDDESGKLFVVTL